MATQTTEKPKVNLTGAFAAGLFTLFLIGLIIGLPVFMWFIWLASVVGYLVATKEIRRVRSLTDPRNERPWRNR